MNNYSKNLCQKLVEYLFDKKIIRIVIGFFTIGIGLTLYPKKETRIFSIRSICWVGRVVNVKVLETMAFHIIKKLFLKQANGSRETCLYKMCIESKFLDKSKNIYSINDDNKVSLFRDIIVLKTPKFNEKGVLLIKYTPAFDAFVALFNLDKVFEDFYLVLEPSWAGACDPSFLMFWRDSHHKNVIIQAIEPKDYKFIQALKGNFIPIDIGSSDWTDQDLFSLRGNCVKKYDLIMISNWAHHKKHIELFKALSRMNMKLSVLLIGFPWGGRTKHHIKKEIEKFKLKHINFEIKENVSSEEVSKLLNMSKVYLLLSKKEGGNKSIIEAFFVNVPAILYKNFVGGVQTKININTGTFSLYEDLDKNIEYMVKNYKKFSPRIWILENSGSKYSTDRLNKLLKKINLENGEGWSCDIYEKVNIPNLAYKLKSINYPNQEDILINYKR